MSDCTMEEVKHTGMGTMMIHKAYGSNAKEACNAVKAEAERLEATYSRFRQESIISRINRSAGIKNEVIHPEVSELISHALEVSALSQGSFDVTIGPLVDLWDYKNAEEPPEEDKIQAILPLINYRDLELDATNNIMGLKKPGQSIDLGGIAKGLSSDCFMKLFENYGVKSAFSNIGGNVSTLGSKPDGTDWKVGIRHPRQSGLLGAVAVKGKAVVTSGDYERFFIGKDGRRYHHILNPKTGYPAEAGLISVTIVTERAMLADAFSTAIFTIGLEMGLDLLKAQPQLQAVIMDDKLTVYVTHGLKECFQAADEINLKYI